MICISEIAWNRGGEGGYFLINITDSTQKNKNTSWSLSQARSFTFPSPVLFPLIFINCTQQDNLNGRTHSPWHSPATADPTWSKKQVPPSTKHNQLSLPYTQSDSTTGNLCLKWWGLPCQEQISSILYSAPLTTIFKRGKMQTNRHLGIVRSGRSLFAEKQRFFS